MILMLRDRWLAWTLLAGLLLRCAAVPLVHQLGYTSDEKEYVRIAERLNEGEGFIDSNGTLSVRAPLYPFLLAMAMAVDGGDLALPHLLNVLCGLWTILLIYVLALTLSGLKAIARWGAVITALTPGLVIYSALLQTEAVAIPFFLASLIAGVRLVAHPEWKLGAWAGFWAGCAALTRAVFLPFALLALFALIALKLRRGSAMPGALAAAIALFLVVMLPWGIRNYRIHGEVIPVSTFGGMALLIGNNPFADGTPRLHDEFAGWFDEQVEQHRGVLPEELTESERSRVSREIALEFVRKNPEKSAFLLLRKAQVLSVYPITNTASVVPLQLGVAGMEFVIALCAIVGITLIPSSWNWVRFPVATILLFLLLHVVLHGDARYRLPVTPLIAMLAGAGVVSARAIVSGSFRPSHAALLKGALAIAALVAAYGVTGWMFINGRIT